MCNWWSTNLWCGVYKFLDDILDRHDNDFKNFLNKYWQTKPVFYANIQIQTWNKQLPINDCISNDKKQTVPFRKK